MSVTTRATSTNPNPGFFSSSKRLALPVGRFIEPGAVRGYPIDMRTKAVAPRWPPPWAERLDRYFPALIQYGLGCYERHLAGDGEGWLHGALGAGTHLVGSQQRDGSWLDHGPPRHTFSLPNPFRCGMAQGEGASLLVRLYLETGEASFAEAASAALGPLSRHRDAGGVAASLMGADWPEEYPTDPPSFVLNGAIFAWWGVRDVGVGLDAADAAAAFAAGVDTLAANLHRFDTGSWSLYCLYPHRVSPVASSFYHALHINQLEAMGLLAPRDEFSSTRSRWLSYLESRQLRWRAFGRKALFRLVVPRNRFLADRLSSTRT